MTSIPALAPLFIIGGGLGALLGLTGVAITPDLGISISVAGLVGMAAIFTGASHAFLAFVIFAFEVTHQPTGILPVLVGCNASYLLSVLLMRTSIMTEKLARRGTHTHTEYSVDYLSQVPVHEMMTRDVVTLAGNETVASVHRRLTNNTAVSHQGFPVLSSRR